MAAEPSELIHALENEWRDALCAKDMDRLRSLVHPRFVLIGSSSSGPFTLSRDQWLDAIQSRDLVTIALDITDVLVLDQVLVATVEARWRVRYAGSEVEDAVLLTDVWVLEDERWQCIRRHSTPISDKA